MPMFTALQIESSDRSSNTEITAWLTRHGVNVISCRDALEAIERVTLERATPDALLIGADWYPDDDWRLVDCMRYEWPSLIVACYGHDFSTVPSSVVARLSWRGGATWLAARPQDVFGNQSQLSRNGNGVDHPRNGVRSAEAHPSDTPLPGKNPIGFPRRSATIVPWEELAALLGDIRR